MSAIVLFVLDIVELILVVELIAVCLWLGCWWSNNWCWGLLNVFCTACVCASHDNGSTGRACSWRGNVKYPRGVASQHLATTNFIGLKYLKF